MADRDLFRTGAAMLRTAVAGAGFILAARTLTRMLAGSDGAARLRGRVAGFIRAARARMPRIGRKPDAAPAAAEEHAP